MPADPTPTPAGDAPGFDFPDARVVAGAAYSFAAWLTQLREPVTLGATEVASPVVEALAAWARHHGLSLDDPDAEWIRRVRLTPSAPSAREGERCREGFAPTECALCEVARIEGYERAQRESLATRPVSGPGTVTAAVLKDAALLADDVAGRLDDVQSVLDRSGSVITAQNVRRCIKDLNRLAAALAGGHE
jgi:hypothetical protein